LLQSRRSLNDNRFRADARECNGRESGMIDRATGFIGAGLMAEAIASGMLKAGVASPEQLYASDPSEARRAVFSRMLAEGHVFVDNGALVRACDAIVLSVKPNVVPVVARQIAGSLTDRHVVISIAAGVPLALLRDLTGIDRLVRVMPNAPALVGAGAAAYCADAGATDEDTALVERMLGAVGLCVRVKEEHMDAVTGLSGSGPAYVYQVIEALSDGGVRVGLPRDVATRLAAQSVLGAAKMVLETARHPAELKDQVATPGGTTIAGLHVLERACVRGAFIEAVLAAADRSRAIGQGG